MSRRGRGIKKSIDWIFLSVFFSLLIIGWLMLYSAVYDPNNPLSYLDFSTIIGKQSLWIVGALVAFTVVYSIDWKFWDTFAYPIYGITIGMLVLVLIVGNEIKGATSWFNIFGFSLQPSELAKFGTAIAVSSYLSSYKSDIRKLKSILIVFGIMALPIFLILLQSDPGSALVFLSLFILFYRRGLSVLFYILGFSIAGIFIFSLIGDPKMVTIAAGLAGLAVLMYNSSNSWQNAGAFLGIALVSVLFYIRDLYWIGFGIVFILLLGYSLLFIRDRNFRLPTLILPSVVLSAFLAFGSSFVFENVLEPHQQDRINVWLNPEKSDPRGSRYNIIQSKLAIGSGGIQGKGFLKGDMTHLNYVPEQTTDFIFSTVGEEQGFMGSFGVIFLFMLLLVRIIVMAERAKTTFIQNYAYAVAGIIFIHFFVNIGMAVGIMPVIGIPLPFLSKGGSALLGFTVMLAALLKMDNAE